MTEPPSEPGELSRRLPEPPAEDVEAELDPDERKLLALVLARVEQTFEQHFHQARTLPDLTELQQVKATDPDLYKFMLRRWEKQHDADLKTQNAPWQQAASGRRYAFAALLAVLCFAGYLAYLGHPGWATGVTVGDLVLLVATFIGTDSKDKEDPTD